MDGLDATREIRAMAGETGSIPIVGVTADAMTDRQEVFRAAGMDGITTKPIDLGRLLATIDEVLDEVIHVEAMPPLSANEGGEEAGALGKMADGGEKAEQKVLLERMRDVSDPSG